MHYPSKLRTRHIISYKTTAIINKSTQGGCWRFSSDRPVLLLVISRVGIYISSYTSNNATKVAYATEKVLSICYNKGRKELMRKKIDE